MWGKLSTKTIIYKYILYANQNYTFMGKTGIRQCTRAVWSTFAENSLYPPWCIDALFGDAGISG